MPSGSNITDIEFTNGRVKNTAASQRIFESRPRDRNGSLVSMNRSTAPLAPSISSKASTRGPDMRHAQRNHGRYSSLHRSRVRSKRRREASKRRREASFVHRAQEHSQATVHQYRSNTANFRRFRDSRTLPSAVRSPPAMHSRRAQLNPDINQEEPSDRFQYPSSSHPSRHAPMAPAPAAEVPMLHDPPQSQTSNQQPYSISTMQIPHVYSVSPRENYAPSSDGEQPRPTHTSEPRKRYIGYNNNNSFIFRPLRTLDNPSTVAGSRVGVVVPSSAVPPLVTDSTGNSASASNNRPTGKRTPPPRHPAPLLSNPDNVLTDARGINGAKGQPPCSEGSESDISMEYECHPPAMDVDMDDNTMEVQNSGDSEDEGPSVDSSPRVSIHREESPPVTRLPETVRVPLYKVASNMPIPLPKAPFTRGRRLLISSDSTKPIAWVSMPGDMHFIDGASR